MSKIILILFPFIFSTMYCFAQSQDNNTLTKKTLVLNPQINPKKIETTYILNEIKSNKENKLITKTIKSTKQSKSFLKASLIKSEKINILSDNEKNPKQKLIKLERSPNPAQVKSKVKLTKQDNN